MHASRTFIVSFLLSFAFAADHVPVTIEGLDPDFDVKCGGTTVKGRDIYNAIAYGMSLNDNDETLKSSDNNPYPSYYGNSERFKWVLAKCTEAPTGAVQHFPVAPDGFFEDGAKASRYRAVYWYNYEQDGEGHPYGYYCGTIYHPGSNNSYSGCDVKT